MSHMRPITDFNIALQSLGLQLPFMTRRDFLDPKTLKGDPFWAFARAMWRYRLLVIVTFVMTIVSGSSLAVGLVGTKGVLDAIFNQKHNLQDFAHKFNEKLQQTLQLAPQPSNFAAFDFVKRLAASIAQHFVIPESTIHKLPTDTFDSLLWIMGVLFVLTLIGATATFLHQYIALTVVNRTITAVRQRAYRATLRAPLRVIITRGPSDAISRIVNDTTQLANGLNILLSKTILALAKGVGSFIAAFIVNWRVSLVALLVMPLLYTVIRKLGKRIKRASERAMVSQSTLMGVTSEALQGLRVVKAHDAESYETGRFHRINKQMIRELNRVRTARAIASPLTDTLALSMLSITTLIVARNILAGGIDAASFVLALVCLAVAGASLKPLTGLANDIQQSSPAANRLRELIALEPEPGREAGLPKLPRHARSIEFRNINVVYPGRDVPALNNVNFIIKHGERIALVGPNGSGKTTALSLVNRMFDPNAGQLLIDGVDISSVGVRSVREQIGVVTQETVLFRGTIRSNVLYGAPALRATDEAMIDACRRARAHDFIASLPLGYDTPVAEQGLSLSGGQRQRIAIARAILRDPSILILDEATSMVDAESEAKIAEAIAEFSKGRTSLIVAHRLSTVIHCDRIVVFDAGKVVDIATHDQLLRRCEVYRQLAKHQLLGEVA